MQLDVIKNQMKNIFLTLDHRKSTDDLPRFIHKIYTESINEKKPMEPVYSSDWLFYNPKKDGIPAPKELMLPPKLIAVCKAVKSFEQDFFVSEIREWIVSERFYDFLKVNQFLEGYYEESSLTLVSDKGKKVSSKNHYLLRFYKGYDEFIDFENSPKIQPKKGAGLPKVYYPDLVLKEGVELPKMFYLDEACFRYSFFVNEEVKQKLQEQQFLGFEFFDPESFVKERQYRDENPY